MNASKKISECIIIFNIIIYIILLNELLDDSFLYEKISFVLFLAGLVLALQKNHFSLVLITPFTIEILYLNIKNILIEESPISYTSALLITNHLLLIPASLYRHPTLNNNKLVDLYKKNKPCIERLLHWFVFHAMGIKYIKEKITLPNDKNYNNKNSTLIFWLVGIYMSAYGLAVTKYELSKSSYELKLSSFYSLLSSEHPRSSIKTLTDLQNYKTTTKPNFFHPTSIYLTLANESIDKDNSKDLMKTTISFNDERYAFNTKSQSIFNQVDLSNAIFDKLKVVNIFFEESILENSSFNNTLITGSFENSNIAGIKLENSRIEDLYIENSFSSNLSFKDSLIIKLNYLCDEDHSASNNCSFEKLNFNNSSYYDIRFTPKTKLHLHYSSFENMKSLSTSPSRSLIFDNTHIEHSSFNNSDLSNSTFNNSSISGTTFNNTILSNSLFSRSKIQDAEFLYNAEFNKLKIVDSTIKGNFSNQNNTLRNIDFSRSAIIANFKNIKWDNINLDCTYIFRANFEQASLSNISFNNSIILNANFYYVKEIDLNELSKAKSLFGSRFRPSIKEKLNELNPEIFEEISRDSIKSHLTGNSCKMSKENLSTILRRTLI